MNTFNDSLAPISLRVIAAFIDLIIISLTSIFIFYIRQIVFPYTHSIETQDILKQGQLIIIFLCSDFSYTVLWQQSTFCGTYGQHLLGLKVVGKDGGRISFNRACGRYFASLASSIFLKLGFIVALFTASRQTLHDLMAETTVLKISDSEKNAFSNNSKLSWFFYSVLFPSITTIILIGIEPLPKASNLVTGSNSGVTQSLNDKNDSIKSLASGKTDDIKCTNLSNGKDYFFSFTPVIVFDKTNNLTYQIRPSFGDNIGFSSDELTDSKGFTFTLFGQLDPKTDKLYISLVYKATSRKTDSYEFNCTKDF
jgi:uncharacterized RDD family membrane protein YckC